MTSYNRNTNGNTTTISLERRDNIKKIKENNRYFLFSVLFLKRMYKIKDRYIKKDARGSERPAMYVTACVCTGCTTNKPEDAALIKILCDKRYIKTYIDIAVRV